LFIIRKEFADNFKSIFEPRLNGKIEVDYVYQDLNSYIGSHIVPEERSKPWGTAHAVLCSKEVVKEPIAVINADDFYGRDAFQKAYTFLTSDCNDNVWSIIGYELLRTLSDHGTVNRGVCQVDDQGNLSSIVERLNISKKEDAIVCEDGQVPHEISMNSKVSMNFWCFNPAVFDYSQRLFNEFLDKNVKIPKSEFFIPIVADEFIQSGTGVIKVIPTSADWFGVTYKEDAPAVKASIDELVASGQYPSGLWN
jgi:UTP-glucose-1-phosphate uridylyltransferase